MNKQDLVVESQLSYSIVLEPVAPVKRMVYVSVRDVTGNGMRRGMMDQLKANLMQEGFVVTDDPELANFMLNATIVQAGNTSKEQAYGYLESGFEGAVLAGGTAAVLGANQDTSLGLGLAGAAIGFLADTMVSDTYYTFVMDVQMRERPMDGDSIANSTRNASVRAQSSNNTATASSNRSSVSRGDNYNWIVYETRIVTTANKMNLKMEEAIPAVQQKTALSLTELML
uniref:complement resistance protein TraT n=1 Tax=Thaumasiovibrio occultus TaxID=1891184 RepID=UPI00131B0E71|nr:complement resistance protein TraT [Thaumasiovibrio occultus]